MDTNRWETSLSLYTLHLIRSTLSVTVTATTASNRSPLSERCANNRPQHNCRTLALADDLVIVLYKKTE